MRWRAGLGTAVALIAACAPMQTEVTAMPDSDFDLRVGAAVRILGTPLLVRFDTVSEDSRCPTDAQCVWEGNATIRLSVDSAGKIQPVELRTSGTPQPASAFGHRIEYRALRPAPTTAAPIPSADYVVTLRVPR
ncbi:MAG TPA: hypothetical protein VEB19_13900 [Gemmatimonadaceae bacterium]|nr:hypothetical protein [Gemmatimonadaceae bacterium]